MRLAMLPKSGQLVGKFPGLEGSDDIAALLG